MKCIKYVEYGAVYLLLIFCNILYTRELQGGGEVIPEGKKTESATVYHRESGLEWSLSLTIDTMTLDSINNNDNPVILLSKKEERFITNYQGAD